MATLETEHRPSLVMSLIFVTGCSHSAPSEHSDPGSMGAKPQRITPFDSLLVDAPTSATGSAAAENMGASASDAADARPNLGLERCDSSVPLPSVILYDWPTRKRCRLRGVYSHDNFCLIARALATVGLTWTSATLVPEMQSGQLISDQRGLEMQPNRIIVNPRSSGEVKVHRPYESMYYCVDISSTEITLTKWMEIDS